MSKPSNWKEIGFVFGIPAIAGVCFALLYRGRKQNSQTPILQSKQSEERHGCIELGGTTIRLAIGIKKTNEAGVKTCELIDSTVKIINTVDPETNIAQIKQYFAENEPFEKVGIASFGPICLDENSPNYGFITTTPKQAWRQFPLVQRVSEVIPQRRVQRIGFDTDVNAAALAEFQYGDHQVTNSLAYITVGTGVGIGVIVNGKCVHGLTHPEGGHIPVKLLEGDTFKGICYKHGNCLEGLVSNHAIAQRLGISADQLSTLNDNHDVWEGVSNYLAQACLSLTLLVSPEVIVIGGGILNSKNLLQKIREQFVKILNQYVDHPRLSINIESYIVKPRFNDSGLLGSMVV